VNVVLAAIIKLIEVSTLDVGPLHVHSLGLLVLVWIGPKNFAETSWLARDCCILGRARAAMRGRMTGATTKRHKLFGWATSSREATTPVWRDDRGAVAVEFAILFPVVMLLLVGFFEFGFAMTEKMQLVHVVQVAAELEAAVDAANSRGNGLAWAQSQLPPPTSFVSTNPTPPCPPGTLGAQITGQWPVSLIMFTTLTLQAYAQACWPTPPATTP